MATRVERLTSLALLLFLHLLSVSSSSPTNPPSTMTGHVKSLCDTAPFPDLCHNSIAQVPRAGANDALAVARSVLGQCLASAKNASGQVNGISADLGTNPARSCVKSMRDSVDVLGQAVEELGRLGAPGCPGYGVRLGNVQAKANTAISNSEDCAAVLQEVPGVKFLDVADTVMQTMQMTSNALMFVDALAPKH